MAAMLGLLPKRRRSPARQIAGVLSGMTSDDELRGF